MGVSIGAFETESEGKREHRAPSHRLRGLAGRGALHWQGHFSTKMSSFEKHIARRARTNPAQRLGVRGRDWGVVVGGWGLGVGDSELSGVVLDG